MKAEMTSSKGLAWRTFSRSSLGIAALLPAAPDHRRRDGPPPTLHGPRQDPDRERRRHFYRVAELARCVKKRMEWQLWLICPEPPYSTPRCCSTGAFPFCTAALSPTRVSVRNVFHGAAFGVGYIRPLRRRACARMCEPFNHSVGKGTDRITYEIEARGVVAKKKKAQEHAATVASTTPRALAQNGRKK